MQSTTKLVFQSWRRLAKGLFFLPLWEMREKWFAKEPLSKWQYWWKLIFFYPLSLSLSHTHTHTNTTRTYIQTDTQSYRHTSQTDTHTDRHTNSQLTDRHLQYRHNHTLTHRQRDINTHTHWQTQTVKQTHKYTHIWTYNWTHRHEFTHLTHTLELTHSHTIPTFFRLIPQESLLRDRSCTPSSDEKTFFVGVPKVGERENVPFTHFRKFNYDFQTRSNALANPFDPNWIIAEKLKEFAFDDDDKSDEEKTNFKWSWKSNWGFSCFLTAIL